MRNREHDLEREPEGDMKWMTSCAICFIDEAVEAFETRLYAACWDKIQRHSTGDIEDVRSVVESFDVSRGTQWKCFYCGETTRCKSSAMMHASLCEKWPYRLEAERLQVIIDRMDPDRYIRNGLGLKEAEASND